MFGQCLGWVAWVVAVPYRRLAFRNLQLGFSEQKSRAELRSMVRRHFMRLGGNIVSSIKIASMPGDAILERVSFTNLELVTEKNQGRGVVFVLSHMGNWELLAQVAGLISKRKIGTIYQQLGNRYIDADVRRIRMRTGMDALERKAGFKRAMQLLKEKGGVGVLADQHAGDKGVWCPFFGRLASTSPLAATLALNTDSALTAAAVYTVGNARWQIVFSEIVPAQGQDALGVTAEINCLLETQIRQSPEDWFWVHNRWKTPSPQFLLSGYKRGIVYPKGYDQAKTKPFRVLLRASNWLGDAVMSAPAVRAIKQGRPDLLLTVLTPSKLADFWRAVPEVDEVIGFEKKSILEVVRKIKGRFDVAVLFPNSVRVAMEARVAGIPRRVGYTGHRRRLLLNQIMPLPKKVRPPRHQVHHYLELAAWIGADVSGAALSASPKSGELKIGLCPGAEYGPAKRWPVERFAEVARRVADQTPCEWLLFGVAKDAEIGGQIETKLDGRCTNLIGKTSLAELIAQLRSCRLLLTNDTGTMHLAAFLGVPTISIFGSTEPALTGPLGVGHTVIRNHVECSPCFLRECPLDFRCMSLVEVEQVTAAVLKSLLQREG